MTYDKDIEAQENIDKLCEDIKKFANDQYGMVKSRQDERGVSFVDAVMYFFSKRFFQ